MDVLRDQTYIGMFEPQDVALLQSVFARLNASDRAEADDARARSLARSIIKLYRHGVRDPQQLFETLRSDRR